MINIVINMLVVFIATLFSPLTIACSCQTLPAITKERFFQSNTVFRAVSLNGIYDGTRSTEANIDKYHSLLILDVYKGDLNKNSLVEISSSKGRCKANFIRGQGYLVFLRYEKGKNYVDYCSMYYSVEPFASVFVKDFLKNDEGFNGFENSTKRIDLMEALSRRDKN